jgi:hypothetical protein
MDTPEQLYKGKISFINYEKLFATIDYTHNGKQKSVNCKTYNPGSDKKPHHYRLGDVVSFQLKLSDRGDKMTAFQVKFLHNEAIDLLIQKSAIENRFSGYLKKAEDQYFVKEWDSYILFPLQLSPWEKPPAITAENEPIAFKLANLEKPGSIVAELFSHSYIPEYRMALQHFNNQIDIEAVVSKVSPYGVYLNLFNDKIYAKLPLTAVEKEGLKPGDTVPVRITHLTSSRIVVKRV